MSSIYNCVSKRVKSAFRLYQLNTIGYIFTKSLKYLTLRVKPTTLKNKLWARNLRKLIF